MGQKGSEQKRRKYDAAFKEEVLKMVQNGRPVPEIAQSLGIGENLIYKWKSRSNTKEQQPFLKVAVYQFTITRSAGTAA